MSISFRSKYLFDYKSKVKDFNDLKFYYGLDGIDSRKIDAVESFLDRTGDFFVKYLGGSDCDIVILPLDYTLELYIQVRVKGVDEIPNDMSMKSYIKEMNSQVSDLLGTKLQREAHKKGLVLEYKPLACYNRYFKTEDAEVSFWIELDDSEGVKEYHIRNSRKHIRESSVSRKDDDSKIWGDYPYTAKEAWDTLKKLERIISEEWGFKTSLKELSDDSTIRLVVFLDKHVLEDKSYADAYAEYFNKIYAPYGEKIRSDFFVGKKNGNYCIYIDAWI